MDFFSSVSRHRGLFAMSLVVALGPLAIGEVVATEQRKQAEVIDGQTQRAPGRTGLANEESSTSTAPLAELTAPRPELVVVPIAPNLAVTAQPSVSDLKQLADAGYRTLISNRPAAESPDQPRPESLADEAARLGMEFVYIPVTVDSITRDDVEAFHQAVTGAQQPVIAHCRTGKRAYLLWAAGEVLLDGRDAGELMEIAKQRGFSVDELPEVVERLR